MTMKPTKPLALMLVTIGVGLSFAITCTAQTTAAPVRGLSGKDVLDLDGSIVRRQLEEQAGTWPKPQAVTAPTATAHEEQEHRIVTKYAPPRTFDVMGVDASADGGPIRMMAVIRWAGQRYTVEQGTHIKGYVVSHIDQHSGTDLVAEHGKGRLHLPRPTLDELGAPDSTEVTVTVAKSHAAGSDEHAAQSTDAAQTAFVPPPRSTMPVPPVLPSGNTVATPTPVPAEVRVQMQPAATAPSNPTSPPGLMPPPGLSAAATGNSQ